MAIRRLKHLFALFCFLFVSAQPAVATPAAGVSGMLSIIPGLGQTANGDVLEGLGWFAATVGPFLTRSAFARQVGFDLWMYNMYDAYRDAKPANGKTTNYTAFENYIAFANPVNLFDPYGATVVGIGAIAGARQHYPCLHYGWCPPMYGFVGMGEEGLFRGFLFPGLTDVFGGKKWAGNITSSALFAVAHATGGRKNLSGAALGSRFLFGMIMCINADRMKYDLRHNIFAHAWYDILVTGNKIEGAEFKVPIYF